MALDRILQTDENWEERDGLKRLTPTGRTEVSKMLADQRVRDQESNARWHRDVQNRGQR